MGDAPPDVQELAAERAARRAAKDFAAADALRDRIARARVDGRRRPRGLAAGADRRRRGAVRPHGGPRRRVRAGRAGHGRRVDPLGRRGVAAGRAPRDRFVPGERGRPRRPLRRRRRDGRARHDVGGTTWRCVQLEPGTGWGAARNAGLKRSRGRVVLAMDGSIEATGDVLGPLEAALADPDDRRLRAVRHRHARPPRVRQHGRPGGRRDRGLLHGVPPRDPHDGRAVRREVPLVPDRGHRVLVPRSRTWGCAPWSFPCPSSATSTGCGSRRRPRTGRGGPSGTSTGSSIGGATGTT